MSDLLLESIRAAILAGLLLFLWLAGRRRTDLASRGWRTILLGFGLLLFGNLMDITDNFESLNRFIFIGDTPQQAILEKLVGFLGGFVFLAIGLVRWIPTVVSQDRLQQSEDRYRSVVKATNAWIWEVNADCIFTHVNSQIKDILGYEPDEVIGKTPFDFMPPDEAQRTAELFREKVPLGESFIDFASVHLHKNGQPVVVDISGVPFFDPSGRVVGFRGINRDITRQKAAECELQDRAAFERIVTTISSDLVLLPPDRIDEGIQNGLQAIGQFAHIDRSYVFLLREDDQTIDNTHEWCAPGIGPETENLQGISLAEELPWLGTQMRQLRDIHVPRVGDLPPEAALEQSHFQAQGIQSLVVVPMISDGSLRGFLGFDSVSEEKEWSAEIIRLLRVVGETFMRCIERTRAEISLSESEQKYRLLAERSSDIIWTCDLEMNWKYVSPSSERITGFTAEESMRMPLDEKLTPASTALAQRTLMQKLEEASVDPRVLNEPTILELEHLRKDGSILWAEVNTSFVLDEQGRPTGLVGVTRDISERKRADAALSQAKEAAEAANEAKSNFLANMSHEIRTPMTAILGFTDILLEHPGEQETLRAANTIRRNGKHLLEIINGILDLSRIEAGKMNLEQTPLSIDQLLGEVVSLMKVRADAKGLELTTAYDGPIPEFIRSDPTRLRQILINLVGNAIKFTEVGTVEVTAGLPDGDSDEPKLEIRVADSGLGISDELVDRLFEPFSQADTSTTRRFGGSGLGLAISRRLARMLGGDIHVETELGKGSTFTVTTATGPLDGVRRIESPAAIRPGAKTGSRPRSPQPTELDCRVLLAEDGPDNQRLIAFLLRKAGAEVIVAENGRVALEFIAAAGAADSPFDVILMDMQMPVMDGYEATRKLREQGYIGPIVALTAHNMTGDRDRCINSGCDDYMSKPIDRSELLAIVARHAAVAMAGPDQS